MVDFEFVNDDCALLYPDETGRPPYEPAFMFKIVFLQSLYNLSESPNMVINSVGILFVCLRAVKSPGRSWRSASTSFVGS